jgi:hypothetical protein
LLYTLKPGEEMWRSSSVSLAGREVILLTLYITHVYLTLVARRLLVDLFIVAYHMPVWNPPPPMRSKVIMESPMPLTPTRCLVKELKIALVARSMQLFVVYAESRLPSLTSFCSGVSDSLHYSAGIS